MTDTNHYIQRLINANPLREPILRNIVQALRLPPGSRGLDIGCGIGLQALLLADAVGPDGHVTGVDLDAEMLAYGEKQARQAGLSERITFHQADASCLPVTDSSVDWVWSVDFAGYPAGNLPTLLKEMIRVVKPGGRVIILAWSSQRLLPGYPVLEDRLNAMYSSYLPYFRGTSPKQHYFRALHWFREAGLVDVCAQTFVRDIQAPLNAGERTGLISLLEMLWDVSGPAVSIADRNEYLRLCQPDSPDFLIDLPDYYAFFTYTLFQGKVSGG